MTHGHWSIAKDGVVQPQRAGLNFTGAGVSITDVPATDRLDVDVPGGGGGGVSYLMAARWDDVVTKTNIGTAFVNVLLGLNGQRQLVDFTGFTQYRVIAHWNVLGTGTQTLRAVDDANTANVLDTVDLSGAAEKERDSGWVALPAWATGETFLRLQAKSTVGTDDPVFRGYTALLK